MSPEAPGSDGHCAWQISRASSFLCRLLFSGAGCHLCHTSCLVRAPAFTTLGSVTASSSAARPATEARHLGVSSQVARPWLLGTFLLETKGNAPRSSSQGGLRGLTYQKALLLGWASLPRRLPSLPQLREALVAARCLLSRDGILGLQAASSPQQGLRTAGRAHPHCWEPCCHTPQHRVLSGRNGHTLGERACRERQP